MVAHVRRMSPEEYLAFERSSPEKHEYLWGEVFAMAGASYEHNFVVANLVGEFRAVLRQKPCNIFPSDLRVFIPATGRYVYPDGLIVCGEPRFSDEQNDTLCNPKVVFEVLSDTTEAYDRGDKFAQYRTIESLSDYVLLSQKEPLVEHFRRQADGSWVMRDHRAGTTLVIESVGCEVAVDELYAKVFDSPHA